MNSVVLPKQSKKFIRILLVVSALWFVLGVLITGLEFEQVSAFAQVFLFTFLDLIFMILLFWAIFFTKNRFQILSFGFFKFICLGFLAITLKRLENASSSAVIMGVGFMWIGPLISGVFLKFSSKRNS